MLQTSGKNLLNVFSLHENNWRTDNIIFVTTFAACFKLATCNPNTANQNIHAYGMMLIVSDYDSSHLNTVILNLLE